MEAYFAALDEPKELIWIEAQDHFFGGALDRFEDAIYGIGAKYRPLACSVAHFALYPAGRALADQVRNFAEQAPEYPRA